LEEKVAGISPENTQLEFPRTEAMFQQFDDLAACFERLASSSLHQDAMTFKTGVLGVLSAYIKDKTLSELGRNAEQLQLHAAAMTANQDRDGLLHLADFTKLLMDAGYLTCCDVRYQV